jgi:hypothetical protein
LAFGISSPTVKGTKFNGACVTIPCRDGGDAGTHILRYDWSSLDCNAIDTNLTGGIETEAEEHALFNRTGMRGTCRQRGYTIAQIQGGNRSILGCRAIFSELSART